MSEKENVGMSKELTAEQQAKKKKAKYTMIKVIVAFCVVLCIVLTVFEMGLTYRLMKAVEVDGTEYSVAEYNWMYTMTVNDTYNSYYQNYGDLAQYFFNPQEPLSEQTYDGETTMADHVAERTKNTLIELTALYNESLTDETFELTEEDLATVDSEWAMIELYAQVYGYTSANAYVEANYGRGVNEDVFRDMYTRYLTAYNYAEHYIDVQEVTSEDMDAYYAENKDSFDSASYKVYSVIGSAAEGEDKEEKMAEAKAEAEKILSGKPGDKEPTEYNYTSKANTNTTYADWVFDSARQPGDKEMFESESAYYVVEFVEHMDLYYNTVNVRHILVAPETAGDEESLKAALEKAESYKAEWDKNPTEENFAELAKKYSTDSSASNGGLYENIYKGQTVTEFNDWCFDPARKSGNCEIIETTYGYHIMYFSETAEDYYTYSVDSSVRNKRYTDHLNSLIENLEMDELFGKQFCGKHFG